MSEVRACPICGREVENTCFHEDWDYRSEVMDAEEAHELREEFAEGVVSEIYAWLGDLSDYELAALAEEIQAELEERHEDQHAELSRDSGMSGTG